MFLAKPSDRFAPHLRHSARLSEVPKAAGPLSEGCCLQWGRKPPDRNAPHCRRLDCSGYFQKADIVIRLQSRISLQSAQGPLIVADAIN